MPKTFMCGACHKLFDSVGATRDHAQKKHRRSGARIFQAIETIAGSAVDDEPSLADRAVEAEIAIAAGQHTDDAWLLGKG